MELVKKKKAPKVRVFKAYIEDWEEPLLAVKINLVGHAKLLHKYGGLTFCNPDDKKQHTLEGDQLHWDNKHRPAGLCLRSFTTKDSDDEDSDSDEEEQQLWKISYGLIHECMSISFLQGRTGGVEVWDTDGVVTEDD